MPGPGGMHASAGSPLALAFRSRTLLPPCHVLTFLGAEEAKSQKVTLNARSLRNRLDEPERPGSKAQQLVISSLFPDASLSKATVKARSRVLNVVLHNLRQRRAAAAAAAAASGVAGVMERPQQAMPCSSPPHEAPAGGGPATAAAADDIIMELVLEGNASSDFAGALTLLLECGQEEQVVAAGSRFLKGRAAQAALRAGAQQARGVRDVALCVAAAHHRLADVADQGTGAGGAAAPASVEAAHGHVCEALRLLKEHAAPAGAAADGQATTAEPLRRQLLDMLLRVTPVYARQLLGGFPSEGAASGASQQQPQQQQPAPKQQRERALEAIKQALWQLEGPRQRQALLGQVRPLLTAAEQVALYEGAPVPDEQLSEQELYDTALACIWEGYTQRWPHHVYRADTLLSLISSREDLGLDVTLERNVCALLLGKEREAQGQLVMAHGTSGTGVSDGEAGEGAAVARRKGGAAAQQGKGGGRGLKRSGSGGGTGGGGHEQLQLGAVDSAFVVMESSDDTSDDLSALEDWAERWLELSVMPGFQGAGRQGSGAKAPPKQQQGQQGAKDHAVSVRSYLSSPKVVVFNQVLRYANEQNLRHVTADLQNMSHEKLQQLLGLWRSSTTTIANTVLRAPKEQPQQQQKGEQPAAAAAAAAAASPSEHASTGAQERGSAGAGSSTAQQGRRDGAAAGRRDGGATVPAAAAPSAAAVTFNSAGQVAGLELRLGMGVDQGLVDITRSMEESLAEWQSAHGGRGGRDGGDGSGSDSDGEDVAAIEAVPWVQMPAVAAEPSAAAGRGAALGGARASASAAAAASAAADVDSDSGDEHSPGEASGSGSPPPLWVMGPRGVIRPRISARIVDPTHGATAKGSSAPAVSRQGSVWGQAAKVGVVGLAVAVFWLASSRRTGPPVKPGMLSVVAQTAAVKEQGQGWRWQRGGPGPVLLPASKAGIEQMIASAHSAASSTSLSPVSAWGLLLSWEAASLNPREGQALLSQLLEGAALKQAKQAAAALAKKGQQQQQDQGAAAAHVDVLSVKQEAGVDEALVRARVRVVPVGSGAGEARVEEREVGVVFRRAATGGGRALGPWRISQVLGQGQ